MSEHTLATVTDRLHNENKWSLLLSKNDLTREAVRAVGGSGLGGSASGED